nr:MAG TPA: Mature oligodendrocyte transmembrane protein [Caudoviricetes sp.]
MNDYDFQEMAFDYATLTRPGSPHIIPGIPAPALLPIPAQIGVACPGQPPLTLWAYAATARHTDQDGTKSRTWCGLPRLENGLYKLCTAIAIAVSCAVHAVTALESTRKPKI